MKSRGACILLQSAHRHDKAHKMWAKSRFIILENEKDSRMIVGTFVEPRHCKKLDNENFSDILYSESKDFSSNH